MTGADVKAIREALGRLLGRRVSCRDLGLALGLAPANAADTVRRWESDGPDRAGRCGADVHARGDRYGLCGRNTDRIS